MDKKDKITIAILIVIFLIILVALIFYKKISDNIKNTEYKELTFLEDETIYLSVNNNLNKLCIYSLENPDYINYITNEDIDYNIYKNKTFKIEEIYVISKLNLYKYYIKAGLYTNVMDQINKYISEEYIILNYNIENSSFNIEIIDEDSYYSANEEKHKFVEVENNTYNKFDYININDKSRASIYFKDFLNILYSDQEKAYNLLNDNTKQTYFQQVKDLTNFLEKYNSILMKEYSVSDKTIGIKDNYGNEYIFYISNVLDYTVEININKPEE